MPTASARTWPDLMKGIDADVVVNMHLHPAADQVGERGSAAAIGHVHHVDAGHHLEQLARTWLTLPLPTDAMLILPGFALA